MGTSFSTVVHVSVHLKERDPGLWERSVVQDSEGVALIGGGEGERP